MKSFRYPLAKPVGLFVLLILTIGACRVTLIPDYDRELAQRIQEVSKQVDTFYLLMLEDTAVRDYTAHATEYVSIQVELNAILQQNRIKPLNENSIRIAEIALQLWENYKNEHEEVVELSNGLIKLNRAYMGDVFYAMLVAEEAKNIIQDNPKEDS